MKKYIYQILVLCLTLLLVAGLAGCGLALLNSLAANPPGTSQETAPDETGSGAGNGNAGNSNLTEDQIVAWALGCSAILAVRNGFDPYEFGMLKKNDANAVTAQMILAQSWGCRDHDSLVSTIQTMTDNGGNSGFVALYNVVAQMTEDEINRYAASHGVDAYVLLQTKAIGDSWGDKQIKAWDWFRMIQIAGWGYVAGYLEKEETYNLMVPEIERLRSTFSSWDDANKNYMDGFVWWSGTDISDVNSAREYTTRMNIYNDLKAYPREITVFDPTLWPDYVPDEQDGVTATDRLAANYEYDDNGDGTCTITGYKWERGDLNIPAEINGLKVVEIGDDAFFMAEGFNGVLTIPDTVETIGVLAFRGCSGLTGNLTIPDSVTTLSYQAFSECSGFNGTLTLSKNLKEIGNSAFSDCYGLSGELTIPEGVVTIGEGAFKWCQNLRGNLVFPENLTTIGSGAFLNCTGLSGTVVIPKNLTNFSPTNIFMNCTGLTSVEVADQNSAYASVDGIVYSKDKTKLVFAPPGMRQNDFSIPEGTKEIKLHAFLGCSGLTGTMTIPDGVTNIGTFAFYGCSSLEAMKIPNSVTSIGSCVFQNCSNLSQAVFLGDAPDYVTVGTFSDCANDFRITYDPAKSGWTTPEWNGYPCYPKR